MPTWKHERYFAKSEGAAFDALHSPGAVPPHAGIYRCENCGDEIASNANTQLPPQNHNQHPNSNLPIKWRLVAATRRG